MGMVTAFCSRASIYLFFCANLCGLGDAAVSFFAASISPRRHRARRVNAESKSNAGNYTLYTAL
jgi:hypothetical protein